MIRRLAAAMLWLSAVPAIAQTEPDLDQLPSAAAPPPPSASPASHAYVQGDLTLAAARGGLVVALPPLAPASAEARAFLDTRITQAVGDDLSLFYSGRFNLRAEDGADFPAREAVRNDLREAYVAWQGGQGLVVELGRINLKSGVAEGFDPTDYFKTRAVVEPDSADPSVLREDRLGTAMALAQMIWPRGSLSLAVAPKLSAPTPPYTDLDLPRFDPMFDRTNADTRLLLKGSVQLLGDLSPEVLAYEEAGRAELGVNLTKGLGRATIVYLEWSGGRRASLAYDAWRDGLETHVLPATPPIPVSSAEGFSNDLSAGLGYTTKLGIHLDLEYDYHQAGFSAADWRHWFAGGAGATAVTAGALWFIRSYAGDEQEPMARSSLFLSADWRNALIRNLNVAAFADLDLRDGSGTGQAAAEYFLSPVWTLGALVDLDLGRARSNFGSLPQDVRALVRLTRYLR